MNLGSILYERGAAVTKTPCIIKWSAMPFSLGISGLDLEVIQGKVKIKTTEYELQFSTGKSGSPFKFLPQ